MRVVVFQKCLLFRMSSLVLKENNNDSGLETTLYMFSWWYVFHLFESLGFESWKYFRKTTLITGQNIGNLNALKYNY